MPHGEARAGAQGVQRETGTGAAAVAGGPAAAAVVPAAGRGLLAARALAAQAMTVPLPSARPEVVSKLSREVFPECRLQEIPAP